SVKSRSGGATNETRVFPVGVSRQAMPSGSRSQAGQQALMRPAGRSPAGAERHKGLIVWGVGLLVLALVVGVSMTRPPALAHLSDLVFDSYQRLEPREEAGAPVVVVDIDERSIAKIGQWPWPRTTVAALVDRLGQ